MNKNLGKKFFSIIFVGLIFIGIYLFNIDKNDPQLEDLYGDRSELGDMSILLQSCKDMYETDQIQINKDNLYVTSMVKQGINGFSLSNKNIDAREVLNEIHKSTANYTNALLEDENRTASFYISSELNLENEYETVANINIKYKDIDKIETYDIPIVNPNNEHMEVYSSVPISIDEDNIYLVILYSNLKEDSYDEESYDKTVLTLYKINLSTKKSKYILTKESDGENIYIKTDSIYGNICFSNENKAYFLIKEKDENNGYYNTSLLEFDVISKKSNIIALGTRDDIVNKLSIDDNKLLLVSYEGNEYGDKATELKFNEVRTISIDLENSNIEYLNHINLNTYGSDILQIRKIDNKIYIINRDYADDEDKFNDNYYYIISVIDEENNELLYKGKINQNMSYFVEAGIVKEDEL